jgi:hypothetical protein
MNFDFFLLLLFLLSFISIVFLVLKKIPVIADLPLNQNNPDDLKDLAQNRFNIFTYLKKIYQDPLIFIQKVLSRIMIFILKLERIVGNWLQKVREKSKKRVITNSQLLKKDDYWDRLKGLTKNIKKDKDN